MSDDTIPTDPKANGRHGGPPTVVPVPEGAAPAADWRREARAFACDFAAEIVREELGALLPLPKRVKALEEENAGLRKTLGELLDLPSIRLELDELRRPAREREAEERAIRERQAKEAAARRKRQEREQAWAAWKERHGELWLEVGSLPTHSAAEHERRFGAVSHFQHTDFIASEDGFSYAESRRWQESCAAWKRDGYHTDPVTIHRPWYLSPSGARHSGTVNGDPPEVWEEPPPAGDFLLRLRRHVLATLVERAEAEAERLQPAATTSDAALAKFETAKTAALKLAADRDGVAAELKASPAEQQRQAERQAAERQAAERQAAVDEQERRRVTRRLEKVNALLATTPFTAEGD